MKAIRIHNFGSAAEVLQYEEVPIPELGPNEFLGKVEAASLNRADLALRRDTYRMAPEDSRSSPAESLRELPPSLAPEFMTSWFGAGEAWPYADRRRDRHVAAQLGIRNQ